MEVISILLAICLGISALRALLKAGGLFIRTGLHALLGFFSLWCLSTVSGLTGLQVPINPVTAVLAGLLGLPGIAGILLLALL